MTSSSPHIVFLTARYPPDYLGGGEISTRITAEGLVGAGALVTVLCGAAEDLEERLGGVRVVRRSDLQSWWEKPLLEEPVSRRAAAVVKRILETFQGPPTILHAQEFRSALSLSLLSHGKRWVTIRDFAPICGTTNNLLWDGSLCTGCFWPNVLFRCHRVVEASLPRKPARVLQYKGNLAFRLRAFRSIEHHLYTSSCLLERVGARLRPPESVSSDVLPNPVDPSWLTQLPRPLPTRPVVCSIGRLEKTKGTDILLDAFAQLRSRMPRARLELAGGGEHERYRSLAHAKGLSDAVTFHGMLSPDAVRSLIDASLVVVSPHLWEEPFGRAALEAGARGRALVTSDIGGVLETTTTDTALRVPAGNVSALAGALKYLLTRRPLAEAMGTRARRHVEEHFGAPAIARQLLAAYARMR